MKISKIDNGQLMDKNPQNLKIGTLKSLIKLIKSNKIKKKNDRKYKVPISGMEDRTSSQILEILQG